jgi:hypothetical protein
MEKKMKCLKIFMIIAIVFFMKNGYAQPTNGLVGYWPLNGYTNDLSGNGNNGTITGGVTPCQDRFSSDSSAYSFNGTSGYITIGIKTLLNITGDMSISLWVKIPSFQLGPRTIINSSYNSEAESGNILYSLYLQSVSNSSYYHLAYFHEYSSGANQYYTFADTLQINTWYHIVMVRNTTLNTVTLYIDNNLKSTYTYSYDPTGGTSSILTLGDNTSDPSNSNRFFLGNMDEVRIYNRVLTTDEIASLYSEGEDNPYYWSVNDSDDVYYNGSGNVGIGTTSPDQKLTVAGTIHAEEVIVDSSVPQPDYVFEDNYELKTLEELETFIRVNKHLPGIPSAAEVEDKGLNAGEMQTKLLEKIEELTLYAIEFKKENERLKAVVKKITEASGKNEK